MAASRLLIALIAVLLSVAVVPAPAMATHNDDFQGATAITDDELFADYFDDNDSTGATQQTGEVLTCEGAPFGKTLWWTFNLPVNGRVDITASGIDSVIWLVPFDGTFLNYPDEDAECNDSPNTGVTETVGEYVFRQRDYYIQIGGYGSGVAAAEGNLDLTVKFRRDSDGDRVLDESDDCPSESGKPSLAGCPDDDNDDIRNSQDRCRTQAGPVGYGGCPDTDGDGKPDPDDACPGVFGDLANGCPRPPVPSDADDDGVADNGPDKCLGEDASPRDENKNGCLDLRTLAPDWIFKPDTYYVRRGGQIVLLGLIVERIGVKDVPRGARVVVTCTQRACRKTVKRANSRVIFGRLRDTRLLAGVRVTIRVSAPGYVGRARVYRIRRNAYSGKSRCFLPGSPRLRPSCSPVR